MVIVHSYVRLPEDKSMETRIAQKIEWIKQGEHQLQAVLAEWQSLEYLGKPDELEIHGSGKLAKSHY